MTMNKIIDTHIGGTKLPGTRSSQKFHDKGPICGKNCTVLGLIDVAEVGVWVDRMQDDVFHVVEGYRVTRKMVIPSKWTEND